MRRLLALLLGGLGIRAFLRRRGHALPGEASPADELRAKLAGTRVEEPPAAEAPTDVDARRADVHDRARKAIDELGES